MTDQTVIPNSIQSTSEKDQNHNAEKNLRSFSPPQVINSTLSISWAAVLCLGTMVTLISYFSGCRGLEMIIRTTGAILIASLLLWSISSIVIKGSGEIAKKINEEGKQKGEITNNQTQREIQA